MHTLAQITLDADAPIGTVLDATETDRAVEEKYFAGWTSAMSMPPAWGRERHFAITIDDGGRKVIEHIKKTDCVLVTGDDEWRDYSIEMNARLLIDTSGPQPDNEHDFVGQIGLVARQRGVRRYYTFRMDGHRRFALYRRRDEDQVLLGSHDVSIDRTTYYHMRLEVRGTRIRCYVNNERIIDVHDHAYSSGKAGVRTNTFCWFDAMAVTMSDSDRKTFEAHQSARQADVAQAASAMPVMVEWKRFPCPEGQFIFVGRPGDQRDKVNDAPADDAPSPTIFLLERPVSSPSLTRKVTGDCVIHAMTINGETLWRASELGTIAGPVHATVGDFTGRGGMDVAVMLSDRMVVLDGSDGSVRAERELPAAGPYNQGRNEKTKVSKPQAVRLTKAPSPMSIILREDTAAGGNSIWAYNGSLNPLWETHVSQPKFGHQVWFFDIDEDGCDEMLLGYYLFDQDGKVIWLLEDAQYADRIYGARHADNTFLGRLHTNDPDRITALHSGGSDGLFFADGRTGRILAHHMVGHAQNVQVGRYRPDLPGLQVCCGNRWGNFGVMTFFDADGKELYQFQPDYMGENFRTVRWGPNGQDLIFMQRSLQSLGFWDAFGRRVVELPEDTPLDRPGMTNTAIANVCGDEQDELLMNVGGEMRIYTQL